MQPEIDLGIHPVDRGVSTQHAVLRIRGSGLTVTDLGSTNGTSINASDDLLGTEKKLPSPTAIAYTSARGPRSRSFMAEGMSGHCPEHLASTHCHGVRKGDCDRSER